MNNNTYAIKSNGDSKYSARFVNTFSDFAIRTKKINFKVIFNKKIDPSEVSRDNFRLVRNVSTINVSFGNKMISSDIPSYLRFKQDYRDLNITGFAVEIVDDMTIIKWSEDFNIAKYMDSGIHDRALSGVTMIDFDYSYPCPLDSWFQRKSDDIKSIETSIELDVYPSNESTLNFDCSEYKMLFKNIPNSYHIKNCNNTCLVIGNRYNAVVYMLYQKDEYKLKKKYFTQDFKEYRLDEYNDNKPAVIMFENMPIEDVQHSFFIKTEHFIRTSMRHVESNALSENLCRYPINDPVGRNKKINWSERRLEHSASDTDDKGWSSNNNGSWSSKSNRT